MQLKSAFAALCLLLACLTPRTTRADTLTFTNSAGGSIDGVDIYPNSFTLTGSDLADLDSGAWDATDHALTTDAQALANDAEFEATVLPASLFVNDLALPDVSGSSAWTNGQPQIFMVDPPPPAVAPEPPTLILFGTGMFLGVAFLQATLGRSA